MSTYCLYCQEDIAAGNTCPSTGRKHRFFGTSSSCVAVPANNEEDLLDDCKIFGDTELSSSQPSSSPTPSHPRTLGDINDALKTLRSRGNIIP